MSEKKGYVYLMTNRNDTVIYTGVTSDLKKRVYEHREKITRGFTSRYQVGKLVYFEMFESVIDAITREKQIKGGSRKKKEDLIKAQNPDFRDLYDEL